MADQQLPKSIQEPPCIRQCDLRSRRDAFFSFAAALMLTAQGSLLAYGSVVHTPSIDELGHMAAGLSHWRLGQFDLYRVNPPLVRMLATLPVHYLGARMNFSGYNTTPTSRQEFEFGYRFAEQNGAMTFWYFAVARWACIPLALLGGFTCYCWAIDLYGRGAGLLTLALWCFGPNILAHGQMITPDMGSASLGVTGGYLYWRWLRTPSWLAAIAAGIALGLAVSCKTTILGFYICWPLLAVFFWSSLKSQLTKRPALWHSVCQVSAIVALSGLVVNTLYGFQDSFRPLGEYQFLSESLRGASGAEPSNRFAMGPWEGVPVPMPKNLVLGIDYQKHEFEDKMESYLRGEWRKGGWWYYYLYGLAVKVPVGAFLLLCGAAFISIRRTGRRAFLRNEASLLLPAIVILGLVSSQTGFNHHLRYILPIFPFAIIWMSKVAINAHTSRLWRVFVLGSLSWIICSSAIVSPHSLSYFNELAGGPARGHYHLDNSNLDWGQNLLFLQKWIDDHPDARPVHVVFDGGFNPAIIGLPTVSLEQLSGDREIAPGWYLISVCWLITPTGRNSVFHQMEPTEKIGYTIFVFCNPRPDLSFAK